MTATPDPFLTSAREILRRNCQDVRAAIEGLPADAVNWRPAGPETNSIAVIATHVMHSTRTWLPVAVGEPLPGRDRPAEFATTARDAEALLAFVDQSFDARVALVDGSRTVDWSAARKHWDPGQDRPALHRIGPPPRPRTPPRAYRPPLAHASALGIARPPYSSLTPQPANQQTREPFAGVVLQVPRFRGLSARTVCYNRTR